MLRRGGCGTGDGLPGVPTSPMPLPSSDPGSTLARPSRWLPFADRSSSAMLDPEGFLPQLSLETFSGEFMAAPSSPTVRRRQLAAELKRLRLAAKLTIEQVAE